MITLNSDKITIEIPENAFDTELVLKLRQSGEIYGCISASQDNFEANVTICNERGPRDLQMEKEALLNFSQYLIHREAIHNIKAPELPYGLEFANQDCLINTESIQAYGRILPVVRVAIVVLQKPDGSILLGKRPEGFYMPGLWEFPGGKLESAESPTDAGVREIREEIGIEIENTSPLACFGHCFLNNHLEGHLLLSTEWTGTPKNLHHSELIWAHPNQLGSYPMPISNVLALPQILKRI